MCNVSPPAVVNPETYLQQAQAFTQQGKPAEADAALGTAIALDARFAPAYILRAVYRGGRGDLSDAKADIEQALMINPESADALFVSAQFAQALHDSKTAKSQVDKALRNSPADWPQRVEAQKLQGQL